MNYRIALLLAWGLLYCPTGASAADSFDVPAILPLTGQAAYLGHGQRISLGLVAKAINSAGGIGGRPLHFVISSDESNPQVAVQLATEIIAAKPAVILGPSLAATCRAVAPLLRNGPVMYCLSPLLSPAEKSYAFTLGNSANDLNVAQIRFFRLKGWKRLAFLFTTDASGQVNEAAIKRTLALPENAGVKAVAIEHYGVTDVSIAAQIERIKAARPDAVFVLATGTPVATAFRGLAQAGLDLPVATGNGSMTYAQMAQYAAFLPKRLYICASQWATRDPSLVSPGVAAKVKQFYDYSEAAGVKPDLSNAEGWEGAMLVATALQNLGPAATATQVRDYFENLQGVPGIYGTYDFVHKETHRGLDVSDTLVTLWDGKAGTWLAVSKPGGVPLQ